MKRRRLELSAVQLRLNRDEHTALRRAAAVHPLNLPVSEIMMFFIMLFMLSVKGKRLYTQHYTLHALGVLFFIYYTINSIHIYYLIQ